MKGYNRFFYTVGLLNVCIYFSTSPHVSLKKDVCT